MKKRYNNPTCKVKAMKLESFLADTVLGDIDYENGIGWGGFDENNGAGADVNHFNVWGDE